MRIGGRAAISAAAFASLTIRVIAGRGANRPTGEGRTRSAPTGHARAWPSPR